MTTAYAFVPAPQHAYPGHPEAPSRFDLLESRLGSFNAEALAMQAATEAEVQRAHTSQLLQSLEITCRKGTAIIDPAPTYVTTSSYADALLAAGGTLACTRAVLAGSAQNAFAIVRPPGHHAESDRAMGFCLFNNIAVAACDAMEFAHGVRRVAIVDYDAHHGNGTQGIFLRDPRVAYLSSHQWGIYPGTGWYEEAPEARRRIVNLPLPGRSGDAIFRRVADEIIDPFLRAFRPDLILVSAGFDAHWNDPLTSLGLSTAGFYMLSKRLADLAEELCQGRVVFVLEGGYDPANFANGCAAVFSALTGSPFEDPGDRSRYPEPDAGHAQVKTVSEWHGF